MDQLNKVALAVLSLSRTTRFSSSSAAKAPVSPSGTFQNWNGRLLVFLTVALRSVSVDYLAYQCAGLVTDLLLGTRLVADERL